MTQDKNFTIRLKAQIEKKLRDHGVINHFISPAHEHSSAKDKAWWSFFSSLDEITLNQLQGIEKNIH